MERTPGIWSEHHGKDNFIAEYPEYSMFAMLNDVAKKHPDFTALEFEDKKISFSKMIEFIEQISKALLASGIKKGDYISVVAPNTPQAVCMVYAINRIGAVANMIHPLLSPAETKALIEKVDSVAVLTFDILYDKFKDVSWNGIDPLMIIGSIADALPSYKKYLYKLANRKKTEYNHEHKIIKWTDFMAKGANSSIQLPTDDGKGEDVAIILYSGGTTGLPKGVMIQNFAFNAMAVQSSEIKPYDTDVTAGKKVLALMPVFHGFGLAMCIHVMLSFGCHLILVPKFDYVACAKLIFKKKINYIYAVPALFAALIRTEEIEKNDLSFIEMIAVGGDKCDSKLLKKMNKYLEKGNCKARIMDAYGITESVSCVCINPFFAMRDGSTGLPLADNKFKIVALGTKEEVAPGVDGELCINGPTLMKGYYKNEEETARALQLHDDGKVWLHTGDIGCVDEDGYFYYRQRSSRMIIMAGNNVYPTQIENVINQCDDVVTSCVVGVAARGDAGQRIVAFVQPTDMKGDLYKLRKEILDICKKNVADFAIPKEIIFKEELPKTAMGKVSFKQLVEEYGKG